MNKSRLAAAFITIGILVLSLGIRLHGIGFGLDIDAPVEFSYHQDESKTILRSMKMAETLDLNPHWFHYPTLLIYANFIALKLTGTTSGPDVYWVGRSLTALFGALTVGLVYLLGKRLYGPRMGWIAGLILAASFLHVRSSHYLTTDVPMTFFSTAAALLGMAALQDGKRWKLWLSFAATGFAAGTKYNGAPAFMIPLLFTLLENGPSLTRRGLHLLLGFLIFLVSFVLTTPFLLIEPDEFKKWFDYIHEYQQLGQFGFERPTFFSNFAYLSGDLLGHGLGALGGALAILGVGLALTGRNKKALTPLIAFSFAYLIWLSTYKTSFTRNMMPIVPFVALLPALALELGLSRWVDSRKATGITKSIIVTAVALLVILQPAYDSIRYNLEVADSTRTRSIPWIIDNLPEGSRISMEIYGPPLFITHPNRYKLDRVWSLGRDIPSVSIFESRKNDYIISNSGAYEMVFSNPGMYPLAERLYQALDENYPVLKTFEGDQVDPLYSSISPTIKIYDCRKDPARQP